jgi:hypothetical protein
MVVADGEAGWCALLRRLKQVVHAIAVDLEVLQRYLHVRRTSRILLNLFASSVYRAQQSGNDASLRQRLSSSHGMRLAGTGTAVSEDGEIEAVEELLYRGRD